MSNKLKQFRAILEEMFQLNQADLDFGIYRIMNQKREEITRFLDHDLLPQVETAFAQVGGENKALLEKELETVIKPMKDAGATPDVIENLPKVKELRERLIASEQGAEALADEVFSRLTIFFGRYYKEGDFISLPRYKEGVYAIPYQGEEVKLHWANADQYYIKTTEHFKDYVFKLDNEKLVHFKIVDASTEQDNNKEEKDKERRFILDPDNPVGIENDELVIRFIYQVMKEKQSKLNEATMKALQERLAQPEFASFAGVWQPVPTEKNSGRTLLEKHLNDYTSKNSLDYFIHKDLGSFLRRELDFYIKNEIMYLDDLDTENEVKVHQYLNKIKVIKRIGHKIIAFLAQLEDFQKKLWLKKKFVVETNYCLTLDRVPQEFYGEISTNQAQLEEWKRLFEVEEIENYTEPLTVEFLQSNLYLVLDTAFFSVEFKERLLASMDDIDGQMDGLLVHSENFQALQLLQERFREQVKCIYIDPPYNTTASEIIYKNNYKHSSWTSFIFDRIFCSKCLMRDDAIFQIAIDDTENYNLKPICDNIFGQDNYVATICIQHNPRGRADAMYISPSHEYLQLYSRSYANLVMNQLLQTNEELRDKYSKSDNNSSYRELPFKRSGSNSRRSDRPNLFYPLYYDPNSNKLSLKKLSNDYVEILPLDSDGNERVWRWGPEKASSLFETEFVVKKNLKGNYTVNVKDRTKNTIKPKTFWYGSKYDASSHGTMLLKNLFKNPEFSYPKSINAVYDALYIGSEDNSFILDYFAGSGTTAHAVINLNREDQGFRKYILVEMGEYFDTVTKPRIQKVIYSEDWKDGKPLSRKGSSHMFKYIRLESYEDTLNNLELRRSEAQQMQLDLHDQAREEYLLSYMLDLESQGSPSLLNLDDFSNPFDYKLNITRRNESRLQVIDLPETFNYLLGLTVRQSEVVRGFKVIRGELPNGERALIIWRNLNEKPNQDLEEFMDSSAYNPRDNEFDRIYINGDNHIENRRAEGDRWKVLLIEEEFKRLMFDVRDI